MRRVADVVYCQSFSIVIRLLTWNVPLEQSGALCPADCDRNRMGHRKKRTNVCSSTEMRAGIHFGKQSFGRSPKTILLDSSPFSPFPAGYFRTKSVGSQMFQADDIRKFSSCFCAMMNSEE